MLVIELQNDLASAARAEKRGLGGALARGVRDRGVLAKLATVLDACRARAVPVIYLTKEQHPSIPRPRSRASIYSAGAGSTGAAPSSGRSPARRARDMHPTLSQASRGHHGP